MTPATGEVTLFWGTLPPASSDAQLTALPSGGDTPSGLILRALDPVRAELDALLARENHQAALRLAYSALAQVADALAATRDAKLYPGQVRIHALIVELNPLPLAPQPDGTLAELGTAVSVSYRNWVVAQVHARLCARALTERLHALWPATWAVVSPVDGPGDGVGAGEVP